MKIKKLRSHLLIADAQVKEGVPLNHIDALRNFIVERQPEVIVNIGDWYDMPSLSSYNSKAAAENKRILQDVAAGNMAMARLERKWPKTYKPKKVFTIGNHEQRIVRPAVDNPSLKGVLGYHLFNLSGWEVYDYLQPVSIDGVTYCHYFYNPMTGKPIGGNAGNMLSKIGFSFTQGHRQELSYANKDLANGKRMHGLVAGAFHMHDEEYKGYQASTHWRGVCLLHEVDQGNYDLEVISLDRLLKEYGK